MVFGKQEASDGRGEGVAFGTGTSWLKLELEWNPAPDVFGCFSQGCRGVGLGFRFAAAGGPRTLTPADLTMTSSVNPGASSRAMLVLSRWCDSSFGGMRLINGGGVSGVAGDESKGVSTGELEREGGYGEPEGLGGNSSTGGDIIASGAGGSCGETDEVFGSEGALRDVVGLCSAEKLIMELPL